MRLAPRHADQFEAAAAEIADHAVGVGNTRDDAQRRAARLGLAADRLDRQAADLADALDKGLCIGRLAHRRRCDDTQRLDAHVVRQQCEAGERDDRRVHRGVAEPPIRRQPTPEAGHDLLVEDRRRRPRQALVHHQTHRVRADVDDAGQLVGVGHADSAHRARASDSGHAHSCNPTGVAQTAVSTSSSMSSGALPARPPMNASRSASSVVTRTAATPCPSLSLMKSSAGSSMSIAT